MELVYGILGIYVFILIVLLVKLILEDIKELNKQIKNKEFFHSLKGLEKNKKSESYEEKLKEDKWHEKRLYLLDKYSHKCKWCGSCYSLQVHHKYYLKYPNNKFVEPWDYPDDAFIVLCKDCHKKWHEKYKNKVYYKKY